MSERIMYVKPGCPYCQAARDHMSAEGIEWVERDATERRDWRDELYEHSNRGLVPTIVAPEGTTVGWLGGG